MTTKFLNQVKLTGTVTPSNAAIAASNDGQVVAEKLQGQINNINSTGSSAYAADLTGGVANNIPYQTAANTTSFIAPVNSAVLVSGATGIPSMSTTLPAVAIGTCTVTDPTTGSSASINTALSNVDSAIPVVAYPIAINKGGTGQITQQLAINSLAGAVTSAKYLRGNGTNVVMSTIQAADVPTLNQSTSGTAANVTGIVALANGGTNANLTASNGGIFYSTGTAGAIKAGTATARQLLLSGASTTPSWSTSTYPTTNAANTLLYASSANTMAALATANSGVLVTSSTGVPSILSAGTTGNFLSASTAGTPAWSTATYPQTTTINQIQYSSAANTVSGLATANSAVLVTSSGGVPSLSTTLPAVAAGACTVTDPTTGSSASINTALSNVFTYNSANNAVLGGPLVVQTAFQSLGNAPTLAAGKYFIYFSVSAYTQASAIITLQVIHAQLYNVTAGTVIVAGVNTIGGGSSYFGGCLSSAVGVVFSVPTTVTVQVGLNNITNVIDFGLYSATITYFKLG